MNFNSRRKFLKDNFKSAFFIAVLAPFNRLFASVKSQKPLPAWPELIEFARWCPNVHNMQPHKVKIISDTEAELYYDPSRLLPVGDPHATFVTVAMGIFIEHLSIAAATYRTAVEVKEVFEPITTSANSLTLFATLKLVPATEKEEHRAGTLMANS